MPDGDVYVRVERLICGALNTDRVDLNADLIGGGMMDSLALVVLITDIEEDFGIELPLDDFDIEAFRSPRSIAVFVAAAMPVEGMA